MRERDVERYLRERVKQLGGRAYKFVSPGNNGVPDRIVMLPGGNCFLWNLRLREKKQLRYKMHKLTVYLNWDKTYLW